MKSPWSPHVLHRAHSEAFAPGQEISISGSAMQGGGASGWRHELQHIPGQFHAGGSGYAVASAWLAWTSASRRCSSGRKPTSFWCASSCRGSAACGGQQPIEPNQWPKKVCFIRSVSRRPTPHIVPALIADLAPVTDALGLGQQSQLSHLPRKRHPRAEAWALGGGLVEDSVALFFLPRLHLISAEFKVDKAQSQTNFSSIIQRIVLFIKKKSYAAPIVGPSGKSADSFMVPGASLLPAAASLSPCLGLPYPACQQGLESKLRGRPISMDKHQQLTKL